MSEELVRADGEVGVEEDFQKGYKMPSRARTIGELTRVGAVILQEGRFKVRNL